MNIMKRYYSEDEKTCCNSRQGRLFNKRKEDKCKLSTTRNIQRNLLWLTRKQKETETKIMEDIQIIKSSQYLTNQKLDSLIEIMIRQHETRSKCNEDYTYTVSKFTFEIPNTLLMHQKLSTPSKNKNNDDYFSFKIKPNMTLSSVTNELKEMKTVERETLSTSYKKLKSSQSPDQLITLKFFEDTENFRNENFVSVKSLNNNLNASSNPFVSSFKSDGELHRGSSMMNTNNNTIKDGSKYRLVSMLEEMSKKGEEREEKEDVTPRIWENTDNYLGSDLKEDFSGSEKKKNSPTNEMEEENTSGGKSREKCGNGNGNGNGDVLFLGQINSTLNTITDNNNETASVTSANILINSSQERFNKVRGFNFKNIINTKKFVKPLRTNSTNKKEEGNPQNTNEK